MGAWREDAKYSEDQRSCRGRRIYITTRRGARGGVQARGRARQSARVFSRPCERRVGWVPQDGGLFPHLDVRGNLTYAGDAELEAVVDLLEVRPLLDRAPRNLSGGERQRVALGRALLSRPRVLLLDEPFAALDRPLRARLSVALARWCAERALPVVLVTHDTRDLTPFGAEVWEVVDGVLSPSSPAP